MVKVKNVKKESFSFDSDSFLDEELKIIGRQIGLLLKKVLVNKKFEFFSGSSLFEDEVNKIQEKY